MPFGQEDRQSDQTYSIVLLEKQHHLLRNERLRAAAERAFGHNLTPGAPDDSVVQNTSTTLLKVGDTTVHMTQSSTPHAGHAYPMEARAGDLHLATVCAMKG